MLEELTDEPREKIIRTFASESGYQTPKVDVRAVLFRGDNEILLVKEKNDEGRWTLPGGWAKVCYSPFEVAMKEEIKETGLRVRAVRLLALYDKRKTPTSAPALVCLQSFLSNVRSKAGNWHRKPRRSGRRVVPGRAVIFPCRFPPTG